MMKRFKYFILGLIGLLLISCDKTDEPTPDPKPEKFTRTIIAYAIASNNLSSYLKNNEEQMIKGMKDKDLDYYNFMVFDVFEKDDFASLKQIQNVDGELKLVTVKQYDRELFATDPSRVREVIEYVIAEYPSDAYDMFFLSHGSAWEYDIPLHSPMKSIGYDRYNGKDDYLNIDELAKAIPEGKIETIWFDECYMGNIETAYEFKDKCEYMVAAPTEIWSAGTPYDLVVPYLMEKESDRIGAAQAMAKFYESMPYTITVLDMSEMDKVAETTKAIFSSYNGMRPSEQSLLCYTRRGVAEPLYDFGQYVDETARLSEMENESVAFLSALNDMIIYTACSTVDFNNRYIDPAKYHGISTHYYTETEDIQDYYYKSLKWYNEVLKAE